MTLEAWAIKGIDRLLDLPWPIGFTLAMLIGIFGLTALIALLFAPLWVLFEVIL